MKEDFWQKWFIFALVYSGFWQITIDWWLIVFPHSSGGWEIQGQGPGRFGVW